MSKKYHIGYICGVFDLFHIGHLNLLEKCKSMCDILIVGVCNDEYVRKVKEKEPVFPENQRLRIINALKVVDDAVLVDIETTNDKMIALKKFNFDVLFSGEENPIKVHPNIIYSTFCGSRMFLFSVSPLSRNL